MRLYIIICIALCLVACEHRQQPSAPWGDVDTTTASDEFDLNQIQNNGELIMLTLSGPETYYDYRGHSLGLQYLLAQKFADKIGVSMRVETCRDTLEMVRKLIAGDADLVAFQLPEKAIKLAKDSLKEITFCGAAVDSLHTSWAVGKDKDELAKALDEWFKPSMIAETRKEEAFLLSTRSVKRHVYAPMLNRAGGIISHYDGMFINYSRGIHWDWRLMAAQCYQESTFDPQAKSWAGACGLMQIMPATADQIGLPRNKLFDPESNIAAAAKYLAQLEGKFGEIRNRYERQNFVLAAYNGGYHHIKDAMALTARAGGNQYSWEEVSKYVLLLSNPKYYNDPIVKNGYMRGSETEDYVRKIRQRWQSYKGVHSPRMGFTGTPQKAKKQKKKYNI